jgi:ribosomal protein S18 acetylase RimI-like enzyme
MITYTWQNDWSQDHITALYQSVGWQAYLQDVAKTQRALRASTVLAAVADDGRLVGLIRGVSDGETILYIQDLLVRPEFQGQHIGSTLIRHFLAKYQGVGQIMLLSEAEPKTVAFYRSLGFSPVDPQSYGTALVKDSRY